MDGTTDNPLIEADALVREAWGAMARQDAEDALRRWHAVRERAPENPDGHVWPIAVLGQAGRYEEAEAMAAAAAALFPGHPELLVQHAWIAMSRQEWAAAARRWAAVRVAAADRVEAYVHGAHALSLLGRLDEAEAIAAGGAARFPDDVGALRESAWIATARGDWGEALRRWSIAGRAAPGQADVQGWIAQALRGLGRLEDGERVVAAALADHPNDTDLLIEQVWLAVAREDWAVAAERLDAAIEQAAQPERVAASVAAVEQRIRSEAASRGGSRREIPPPPTAPPPVDNRDAALGKLMLCFESIGERCDFGAVQRHAGVEPLGLLRFAWSKLDALVAALDDRFAVVGSDEDTSFERWQDETIVLMRKYGLIFHTFVYGIDDQPAEQRDAFRHQQRRRLVFLRDKLVRDLEDPQKILVYATGEFIADEHVARLFAALRAYGPNTLLYVRPERPDRPSGTVERLDDGLFAGYFPGPADFLGGHQPPFELWVRLCRQTYRAALGDAADEELLRNLL